MARKRAPQAGEAVANEQPLIVEQLTHLNLEYRD